jgi:hypothetical protein
MHSVLTESFTAFVMNPGTRTINTGLPAQAYYFIALVTALSQFTHPSEAWKYMVIFCLVTCYTLVSCSTDFLPWRWRWYFPPNCPLIYGPQGAISQKIAAFIVNFLFINKLICKAISIYQQGGTKQTPWPYRERTIPTERKQLVGEVCANVCWWRVSRGQRNGSPRPYSRLPRPKSLIFLPSSSSVVLARLSGPRSRPTTSQKI